MDTISDLITRIRNAYLAGKETITLPYARLSESVANLLTKHGYLSGVAVKSADTKRGSSVKTLELKLTYKDHLPILTEMKRVSKPGRRVTVASNRLPKILDGYGIAIVSTSQGVMTGEDARKKHIGGEVLLTVY